MCLAHRTRIHGRSDTIVETSGAQERIQGETDRQNVPFSQNKSWNRRGADRRWRRAGRAGEFRERCRRGCFGFEVAVARRNEWYFGCCPGSVRAPWRLYFLRLGRVDKRWQCWIQFGRSTRGLRQYERLPETREKREVFLLR